MNNKDFYSTPNSDLILKFDDALSKKQVFLRSLFGFISWVVCFFVSLVFLSREIHILVIDCLTRFDSARKFIISTDFSLSVFDPYYTTISLYIGLLAVPITFVISMMLHGRHRSLRVIILSILLSLFFYFGIAFIYSHTNDYTEFESLPIDELGILSLVLTIVFGVVSSLAIRKKYRVSLQKVSRDES